MSDEAVTDYPGSSLGLPASGRGSLASWRARIAALIIDWASSMVIATLLVGEGALHGGGWRGFVVLAVYVAQKAVMTWLASGSFGQLLARVAVVRVGGGPIGPWRAIIRAIMVGLVVPAVVVGAERRGLDDLVLGTVVVNRVDGRTA
jgi:RDD family